MMRVNYMVWMVVKIPEISKFVVQPPVEPGSGLWIHAYSIRFYAGDVIYGSNMEIITFEQLFSDIASPELIKEFLSLCVSDKEAYGDDLIRLSVK